MKPHIIRTPWRDNLEWKIQTWACCMGGICGDGLTIQEAYINYIGKMNRTIKLREYYTTQ